MPYTSQENNRYENSIFVIGTSINPLLQGD